MNKHLQAYFDDQEVRWMDYLEEQEEEVEDDEE